MFCAVGNGIIKSNCQEICEKTVMQEEKKRVSMWLEGGGIGETRDTRQAIIAIIGEDEGEHESWCFSEDDCLGEKEAGFRIARMTWRAADLKVVRQFPRAIKRPSRSFAGDLHLTQQFYPFLCTTSTTHVHKKSLVVCA